MNINGFNAINNENNNNNNKDNPNNGYKEAALFAQSDPLTPSEIRNQSFFGLIKSICCPNLKSRSVIFILSCIDVIVYIITLLFGITPSATELLAPKFETLDLFGMKYPSKIYRGQLHRLILFGLLHANLVHLVSNIISQLILGSHLEEVIGPLTAGLLYLFSNIFGGLFSSVLNPVPGVGASVAIFGILGGYVGFMMMNWNYLENKYGKMNNFFNLLFAILIVGFNISFGLTNPMIDNYGHLGGLIYGFFLIWVMIKPIQSDEDSALVNYQVWKKISWIIIIGLTSTLILAFWNFIKPM